MSRTTADGGAGRPAGPSQLALLLRPVRSRLIAAALLQLVAAVATVLTFIALGELLITLIAAGVTDAVRVWAWIAVGTLFAVPVAHGISFTLSFGASRQVEYAARRAVVAHLERLPLGWFTRNGSAQVRKTVGADIGSLSVLVGEGIPMLPRFVATTVLATGYLLWVDWRLALIVLAPTLAATAIITRQRRNPSPAETAHEEAARLLGARTTELAQGISVFKVFGQAQRGTRRFGEAADSFAQTYLLAEAVEARRTRATSLLSSWIVTIVITAVAGTAFTAAGWIDGVVVVPFLLLSWIISRGVWSLPMVLMAGRRARMVGMSLAQIFGEAPLEVRPASVSQDPDAGVAEGEPEPEHDRAQRRLAVGVDRRFESRDVDSVNSGEGPVDTQSGEVADPAAGAPEIAFDARSAEVRIGADTERAAVEFVGVSFGYRADAPVLREIDLRLEPGTVTAVVGASGSGKSTLARLIPRFWDIDAGAIRLRGRDIRELEPDDLYRELAFVFQDPQLLRRSIADNIRLARPDADDATVAEAARLAGIADRIAELPRGYDSVIGADARLSGGESQRVAIARAVLADAPILVLDEPTASADPESAARIQDALSNLMADKTTLVIAHQLTTVTDADRIVVLDEGRIAESGTHTELLAANGRYARMWAASTAQEVTAR
ncbi:ABC transporter ATP-binding protein [Nocardia lasii]|uniref:ABC transporter ATP-binding protein n=1 Tax=Nocardia lasii TaxID=1616107 RepID=A0ABW1JXY2_9NOCA